MKELLIKVCNRTENKAVQEKLFSQGHRWAAGQTSFWESKNSDYPYYLNTDDVDKIITCIDALGINQKGEILSAQEFLKPKGKYRLRKAIEKRIEELNNDPDFIKDALTTNKTVHYFEYTIAERKFYITTCSNFGRILF